MKTCVRLLIFPRLPLSAFANNTFCENSPDYSFADLKLRHAKTRRFNHQSRACERQQRQLANRLALVADAGSKLSAFHRTTLAQRR